MCLVFRRFRENERTECSTGSQSVACCLDPGREAGCELACELVGGCRKELVPGLCPAGVSAVSQRTCFEEKLNNGFGYTGSGAGNEIH